MTTNKDIVSKKYSARLACLILAFAFPQLSSAAAYLNSISSNPPTVQSGGTAVVTVRVSEPCSAGGCVVGLYSQKPALFPLPSSVTIPEGASSVGINVQAAVNNTGLSQYIIIQANMDGIYKSYGITLAKPIVGPVLSAFNVNPSAYVYSGL